MQPGSDSIAKKEKQKITVLVVEDDHIVGLGIQSRLKDMGYEVPCVVATGANAIASSGQIQPDIIIMDISLEGEMNGIEAAAQIKKHYGIPVIFLSAHSDENTLIQAAATEPFAYLTKPFDDKTLRISIQMALYKNAMQKKLDALSPAHEKTRSIVLKKKLHGITLLLYDHYANRFPLFKKFFEESLSDSIPCYYAFFSTGLLPSLRDYLNTGEMQVFELREGQAGFDEQLQTFVADCLNKKSPLKLFCLADFSVTGNVAGIKSIKKVFSELSKLPDTFFSGVLALPMDGLESNEMEILSEGIHHIIILSGKENMISFSPHVNNDSSITTVSQEIMDGVVKKSLEVLILSCLNRPVSGFDILKEINNRFHVVIPLARVYTYLYELEKDGVLVTRLSGRSKMYVPTEQGGAFIIQRLNELTTAYDQVLGVRK